MNKYVVHYQVPLYRSAESDSTMDRWKILDATSAKVAAEHVAKHDMSPESWYFPIEVYQLDKPDTFRASSEFRVVQVNQ